jgi:hypothetical protein
MDHSCFMLDASDTTIGASNEAEVPLSLGEPSKQIEMSHVVCADPHMEWGNLEMEEIRS